MRRLGWGIRPAAGHQAEIDQHGGQTWNVWLPIAVPMPAASAGAPSRMHWPAAVAWRSAARCHARSCGTADLSARSQCRCRRGTRADTPPACGGTASRAPCRLSHAGAPIAAAAAHRHRQPASPAPRPRARTKTPSVQSAPGRATRRVCSRRCCRAAAALRWHRVLVFCRFGVRMTAH